MPTGQLCEELLKQYQCQSRAASNAKQTHAQQTHTGADSVVDNEYLIAKRRRVVKFVRCWMLITREHFFQQAQIQTFLTVSCGAKARPMRRVRVFAALGPRGPRPRAGRGRPARGPQCDVTRRAAHVCVCVRVRACA